MFELIVPILVGWALGYIVNYLADVLPSTRRLSRPVCMDCGAPIPFLDYLAGRRCRKCNHSRPFRTWLVMIALVAVCIYVWLAPPARLGFWLGSVLMFYFTTVFVIDAEHRLILHPTSVIGALLGFGTGWLSHGLVDTLIGGFAGFLIMLVFYFLGVLFSRFRARRLKAAGQTVDDEDALGAGDVILAGILGLALGWPLIWFGILLGVMLAGVYALLLVIQMLISRKIAGKSLMVFMPYGPFFIISAFLLIFLPGLVLTAVPK